MRDLASLRALLDAGVSFREAMEQEVPTPPETALALRLLAFFRVFDRFAFDAITAAAGARSGQFDFDRITAMPEIEVEPPSAVDAAEPRYRVKDSLAARLLVSIDDATRGGI